MYGFNAEQVTKNFYIDSVPAKKRGKCFSLKDSFGSKIAGNFIENVKVHDANFAFLTTKLSKLYTELVEPVSNVTYHKDIPQDIGGGFVDYVTHYEVDWSGIMNEFNLVGNNANIIPRINAGLNQKRVNVYTWEVAYDLRFIELEKMKKIEISKSIEEIYKDIIIAGWDLFAQKVAYTGINGGTGLFNSDKVMVTAIDNSTTTGQGFEGMNDDVLVSFFNGIFEMYLINGGYSISVLPDTILFPTFVGKDLSSRYSELYTNTLRSFIKEHNLAIDETGEEVKVTFASRPQLDTLGTYSAGRIVAYKKDKRYVRIDIPHPMQHYVTMPNIERMAYTSAFAGQISDVQLPYNTDANQFGIVTYWDFTTTADAE